MDDEDERQDIDPVRIWRYQELRRLGYKPEQRRKLVELIEAGEIELQQVRHLTEDLGATPEEAWWVLV
jgi:hypothetical protein